MKATMDQERMLGLLKVAIDHNTDVMQIVGIELSGGLDAKNRTHQKKVVQQMINANDSYRKKLNFVYGELEKETKDQPEKKS